MKTGLTISCIGHALALGCALFALSATPMEVPPVDSLPVQFISDKDFTQLTQGVKNAPKLKIDMPKPLADKIDAPKRVDQQAPKAADKPAITRNGALQPLNTTRYADRADAMAPAKLPQVFITAETAPAESQPMSSVMAQETPTVDSNVNSARQESQTEVSELFVSEAGTIKNAESRKPPAPTMRRAVFRSPDRLANRSENQPPKTSPTVPANRGKLA